MSESDPSPMCTALQPLLRLLVESRCARLLARPGWVVGDRADGSALLDVPWSVENHEMASRTLRRPIALPGGHTAALAGPVVVLSAAPDPLRRTDDLAREGRISPLAARLLSSALGLGRNVLLAGPWSACAELGAALLAEGVRPAVLGATDAAAPPPWPRLGTTAAVRRYGADRLGAWTVPVGRLVVRMTELSSVVGWVDADRIDRALLRFEAALSRSRAQSSAPLHVLAGVDLVAVLCRGERARVQQIVEVCLAEEGYRPSILFAAGMPPAPTALVPVAAPTFLDALDRGGDAVLADEIRHALGGGAGHGRAPTYAGPPVALASTRPAAVPPPIPRVELPSGPPLPGIDLHEPGDVSPPGWELDQLGDDVIEDSSGGVSASDSAAMAAAYGLAPPPPPAGAAASGLEGTTFAGALRRAKAREEQLLAEDEDGPGER